MREVVFLNGQFLAAQEAAISAIEPGFLCGLGLFETMRAYYGKIVYLGAHLNRLKQSAKFIGLNCPYSVSQLKQVISKAVKINNLKDAYVRLTLWKAEKGLGILVFAKKYQPFTKSKYRKGFSASFSSFRQSQEPLMANIKTTNRIFYELSLKQARGKGFDEAIILNSLGYIAEASRSNLFFVKDSRIFTPALECGCLAGITRKIIFDMAKKENLKIYEGRFTREDLYNCDEAFLSNSLMGIMPLTLIEKQAIADKNCGSLTACLIKKYNTLLKNGD